MFLKARGAFGLAAGYRVALKAFCKGDGAKKVFGSAADASFLPAAAQKYFLIFFKVKNADAARAANFMGAKGGGVKPWLV